MLAVNAAPSRDGATAMEIALEAMMTRCRAILAEQALTQETLVEIMSIYNNVAYIFLYLEAIDDTTTFERLLPWRQAFYQDHDFDREILGPLEKLNCPDPEVEASRLEFVDQIKKGLTHDSTLDDHIALLLASAKSSLEQIQQNQRSMLERIGIAAAVNPPTVFYKLMGETASASTRQKLALAWAAQRDPFSDALTACIDEIIETRRKQSAEAGYLTVMQRTLARCRVDQADVESFLDHYLTRALEGQEKLEAEVREITGADDSPRDHFGFAMHIAFGGVRTPMFALDECLDYIFAVARSVFGLEIKRLNRAGPEVIAVGVWQDGQEVGEINFDLWDKGKQSVAANHTKGIRNRTDWEGMVQRPVAYVSCRFGRDEAGTGKVTFQNVHSLFHEFGHAINHLLVRRRISFQSGLEYLPAERLEHLSMWFEKWAYHHEFARYLSLPGDDEDSLARCQRIKLIEYRRSYAERAVTAVLDFDVHRSAEGGLQACYASLDKRAAVSRYCAFGDFPAYFTWPMFMANPGANFSYLLGAADSCEKFAPFQGLSLDDIAAQPQRKAMFDPCFDFDLPSTIPDSAAVFAFYDPARLSEGVR